MLMCVTCKLLTCRGDLMANHLTEKPKHTCITLAHTGNVHRWSAHSQGIVHEKEKVFMLWEVNAWVKKNTAAWFRWLFWNDLKYSVRNWFHVLHSCSWCDHKGAPQQNNSPWLWEGQSESALSGMELNKGQNSIWIQWTTLMWTWSFNHDYPLHLLSYTYSTQGCVWSLSQLSHAWKPPQSVTHLMKLT